MRAAVARYVDRAAASADGYRRFGDGAGNPLMGEHWFRRDLVDEPLDLERPSTLIYATIDGEKRLVGVAWTLYQRPALSRTGLSSRGSSSAARGELEAGEGRTELTMLHAWIGIENPAGMFANDTVALPYARTGLPLEWARADNPAAAKGVGLLLPRTCPEREDAVADACDNAAARVGVAMENALSGTLEPTAFNAAAAEAWEDYARVVFTSLTPEQRARLEALEAATMH